MKENIKNTEIHYRLEGNGESRVVLLHGWGCDMKLMAPVADALVQTHRVLLVDFRVFNVLFHLSSVDSICQIYRHLVWLISNLL